MVINHLLNGMILQVVPSLKLTGFALENQWLNEILRQVRPVSEANSTPKTNMTMEHRHVLTGDTSSNGCAFIVMIVFWGNS